MSTEPTDQGLVQLMVVETVGLLAFAFALTLCYWQQLHWNRLLLAGHTERVTVERKWRTSGGRRRAWRSSMVAYTTRSGYYARRRMESDVFQALQVGDTIQVLVNPKDAENTTPVANVQSLTTVLRDTSMMLGGYVAIFGLFTWRMAVGRRRNFRKTGKWESEYEPTPRKPKRYRPTSRRRRRR